MIGPRMIFQLNGPPYCGKDTVADALLELLSGIYVKYKMTTPMDKAIQAKMGWSDSVFKMWREEKKEEPIPGLGISMRKYLQTISEKWWKPTFGEDIFGKIALGHLAGWEIISDCGFECEQIPIAKGFPNHLLVRIHRDGCTFEGDTREYIDNPEIRSIDFENNGPIDELKDKIEREILSVCGTML